jgi:hypothetical protein
MDISPSLTKRRRLIGKQPWPRVTITASLIGPPLPEPCLRIIAGFSGNPPGIYSLCLSTKAFHVPQPQGPLLATRLLREALKLLHPEEQPDIEAIDSDHEEWSANTYLAVRHLVRLQPYVDFKEAVADACEAGGGTTGQEFKSQPFYDESLEYADQVEQDLLRSEIASSPFKILVIGNDCKDNISATAAYFVVKGANGWMHVEQRCLGVERLHQEDHQTVADHVTNVLMEAY